MKRVYIYTSVFPYSLMAEAFISEELRVANAFNCGIYLVPIGTDKVLREVPDGVHLDNSLCKRSIIEDIRAIIGLFKLHNIKELFLYVLNYLNVFNFIYFYQ